MHARLGREQRAIVTDIPGTTRDSIEEYADIGGVPLRIIDTAGIRATEDVVEKIGVDKARSYVDSAALVLALFDSSRALSAEDEEILQLIEGYRRGERLLPHGIAFTGGVLVTMGVLAGALLALRGVGMALGWGFQLQSPWVVSLLLVLFVAITINLLGVFEFTAASHLADTRVARSAPRTGAASSFFTGILAVIVASPCTAPFMGAALGYAVTQPAVEAIAVFLSLGLGMALPWLLLCIFPGWSRMLPRPGAWMDVFRKVMAIPMALAVVWLGWVMLKWVHLSPVWPCAVAAVFTIWSGANYARQGLAMLRSRREKG